VQLDSSARREFLRSHAWGLRPEPEREEWRKRNPSDRVPHPAVDKRKEPCSRVWRGMTIVPATHHSPLKIPSRAFFGGSRIIWAVTCHSPPAPLHLSKCAESDRFPRCNSLPDRKERMLVTREHPYDPCWSKAPNRRRCHALRRQGAKREGSYCDVGTT